MPRQNKLLKPYFRNKMDILLGLQWGDEGKGKIVDFLAPKYNMVARFQGGPNAGHTLEFDGRKHVLHQIPSGIFHTSIENVIGNGVVLDPVILKKEILTIQKYGHDVNTNLSISRKAHLILPTHRLLDLVSEKLKGDNKIGSTLKGIGPVYQDKIGRDGLRVGDLENPRFEEMYRHITARHLKTIKQHKADLNFEELEHEFFEAVELLKKLRFVDSEYTVNKALADGHKVLAEGAQGALLDIDFGSYPFVTSSNTFSAGACTGLGVPPTAIRNIFGIFKAYCTRVGAGPFPTELFDETGEAMQREGREFGATTGRPRRCGWLDLPALKYAVMINGVTELYMMKADVLNVFSEIKVCTHYRKPNGELTDKLPYEMGKSLLEPVYQSLKGWQVGLEDIDDFDGLPQELKNYITFIENEVGVPIKLISVGPDRTQTIVKD